MAVLEHIHPAHSVVFDEMVRIGRCVLAIEPTGRTSHRQYPHDIPTVFGDRGMRLVCSPRMADLLDTKRDKALATFFAYRFVRPE
jgi:hypothetical protein